MNGYKPHLDLLRITACFFVVVNHTNSRLFMGNPPSLVWFISVIIFYISKTAVPIFIMVSGALLLGREESYKNNFRRMFRVTLTLVLFSCYYFLITIKDFTPVTGTDIINFFKILYSDSVTNAFWYLYLYIGLLLMLPLLRKMIRCFKNIDYIYFFSVSAITAFILPVLFSFFKITPYNTTVITPLFNGYVTYFITGYYIENVVIQKSKSSFFISVLLFIAFVLFSVLMTYFEFQKSTAIYPFWDNRLSFNIVIPSCCLFYIAKFFSGIRLKERTISIIKILSSCTFGIYLFSDMLIGVFEKMYVMIYPYIGRFPAVITLIIFVFFSGLIITYYLKKIPFMRYLI